MISVGIDAAKGKSTVCISNRYGEVLEAPHDMKHTKSALEDLSGRLKEYQKNDEVKIVMEATGVYHWPVFQHLKEEGFFVSVINPLQMKNFARENNFRNIKTDKIDSTLLATYGTQKWECLNNSDLKEDERTQLKTLARAYDAYQKPKVNLEQILDLELEKVMPGIKEAIVQEKKLYDFVLEYWHYDNITKYSEKKFTERLLKWAKKKGYRFQQNTPSKIYSVAKEGIPTVPCNEITKLTVTTSVQAVKAIDEGLESILTQIREIAKRMPEYEVVRSMSGVGDKLASLLIAEIGDIRLYHHKKSLVCAAGIDVPPHESGQFKASKLGITKKGNRHLRRHLYLVMYSLIRSKPKTDRAVVEYILKKKSEHKADKQAKVAGMRKFLHIYYARVKERYKELNIWN